MTEAADLPTGCAGDDWRRSMPAAAPPLPVPGLRMMLRRRVARGKEIADRLPERRGMDDTPRPPGG